MSIEAIHAAEAKRARRSLRKTAFVQVQPTYHPGASFDRAARRAEDRRERALAPDHGSAAMAKHRHRLDRRGKVRRPKKAKAGSFDYDACGDTKQKRRAWANARETERQRTEAEAMAARAGVDRKHFYSQFGSLQVSVRP